MNTPMYRRVSSIGAGLLLVLAAFVGVPRAGSNLVAAAAGANYIRVENAKPGTSEWRLTRAAEASGIIEGYASLTSVNRGRQIRLFVNTVEPTYTMDIFRLGYYGGLGGRRMMGTISRKGTVQAIPPPDPEIGIVECNWINPYVLNIPNTADPTDWMSGIYLVKLTAGTSGKQQYIVFAVRDDARYSDALMLQTVNTYHAYNPWGGKSLYGTIAARGDNSQQARKVSFDRPYYYDMSNGAGRLFNRELNVLRWFEREGYDVTYASQVDMDTNQDLLLNHKAILSVGHDEYWSWKMRDAFDYALARGVSFGFVSGDVSAGQVRLEPSMSSGRPSRTLVHYRNPWLDPITPDYLKTGRFRRPPINRGSDAMTGTRYVTQARPAFVVEDASHPLFTGTGLANGDRILNPNGSSFMGYEIDSVGPLTPPNVHRLAHSPSSATGAYYADMVSYTAPSGASVVSIGSIGWSFTIPSIQQLTRNIMARLIRGSFQDATPIRPLLPRPFVSADIGNVGRAGFVSLAGIDSFTLNGAGKNTLDGTDALFYAYQHLSGDGEIVARLTAVENYWGNRAGLMVRETLAPESKYVAVNGRPSESAGVLREGAEFWVKSQAGTRRVVAGRGDRKMPNWLKLTRAGNTFSGHLSSDGVNWTLLGTSTVPMNRDAYIGAAVLGARHKIWVTAKFDNVLVVNGK